MGFFFDALRSMLAESEEGRMAARASMAGKMWHTEGRKVGHPADPEGLDFEVWHFPMGGKHADFAVTMRVGLVQEGGRELFVCTLADETDDTASPWAQILAHVRTRDPVPAVGEVVRLPDGALGRSSHRQVLLAPPQSLRLAELPDYEAVLESSLVELVTVTDREAAWIAEHSGDALISLMKEQGVRAMADRRAGDTRLP